LQFGSLPAAFKQLLGATGGGVETPDRFSEPINPAETVIINNTDCDFQELGRALYYGSNASGKTLWPEWNMNMKTGKNIARYISIFTSIRTMKSSGLYKLPESRIADTAIHIRQQTRLGFRGLKMNYLKTHDFITTAATTAQL
jgi:hypothetical protein